MLVSRYNIEAYHAVTSSQSKPGLGFSSSLNLNNIATFNLCIATPSLLLLSTVLV